MRTAEVLQGWRDWDREGRDDDDDDGVISMQTAPADGPPPRPDRPRRAREWLLRGALSASARVVGRSTV